MYIIPKPGLVVFDPSQMGTPMDRLPPEGREVQPSMYWTRRLIDGDVMLAGAPTEVAEAGEPSAG